MITRTLLTLAVVGALAPFAAGQSPSTGASASLGSSNPISGVLAVEAQVREKPMLERPNRLGHFYGNTVRRRHYGTLNVNAKHSDRPIARYFYIP